MLDRKPKEKFIEKTVAVPKDQLIDTCERIIESISWDAKRFSRNTTEQMIYSRAVCEHIIEGLDEVMAARGIKRVL